MYLCTRNYDLKRGGTFETAKAGTFHSVTAGTLIPLSAHLAQQHESRNKTTSFFSYSIFRISASKSTR
jgi:hypothetical protein